jgi:hypothetical protein
LESDSINNSSARTLTDVNFHLVEATEHSDDKSNLFADQPDAKQLISTKNYAEQFNNIKESKKLSDNHSQSTLKSDTNNNNRKESMTAIEDFSNTQSTNMNSIGEINRGGEAVVTDKSRSLSESTTTSDSTVSCYLCIKVNKNKDFISCPLNRKMKNRLKSEFWFQINDCR